MFRGTVLWSRQIFWGVLGGFGVFRGTALWSRQRLWGVSQGFEAPGGSALCRGTLWGSAPPPKHQRAGLSPPRGARGAAQAAALTPPRPRRRLGEMVKLFIGNLPREATEQEIRSLFEQYGKVLELSLIHI